ncbi:hypothetical protein ACJJTC_010905 [Scirpophaga incertulas]
MWTWETSQRLADEGTTGLDHWCCHVLTRSAYHVVRAAIDLTETRRGRGRPPTAWLTETWTWETSHRLADGGTTGPDHWCCHVLTRSAYHVVRAAIDLTETRCGRGRPPNGWLTKVQQDLIIGAVMC